LSHGSSSQTVGRLLQDLRHHTRTDGAAALADREPQPVIQMTIELITPIAMDDGLRFAIREGGRTVGAGVVTKILK